MRKTRYREDQIIRVLQEVESGSPVKEACREYRVSTGSDYAWKAEYCSIDVNVHWFLSLPDARRRMEAWRVDFNRVRPHSSQGYVPPSLLAEGASVW